MGSTLIDTFFPERVADPGVTKPAWSQPHYGDAVELAAGPARIARIPVAPRWARAFAVVTSDVLVTAAVIGLLEAQPTLRALAVAVLAPVALACVGAQKPSWRRDLSFSARASRLLFASIASLWLGTAMASLIRPAGSLAGLLGATIALPVAWMLTRRAAEVWFKQAPIRTVVVGPTQNVADFISVHGGHDADGTELVGYLDDCSPGIEAPASSRLGGLDDLADVLSRASIHRVVIVGVEDLSAGSIRSAVHASDVAQIELDLALRELAGSSEQASVSFDNGVPLLRVRERPGQAWQHGIKRSFDVVLAGIALTLLAPILATAALIALLAQGRPLFFRQTRVGQHGRSFEIIKFRTMTADAEAQTCCYLDGVESGSRSIGEAVSGLKAAAQNHVTPIGAVLRKTSLDELPQLWNVLRGEMSLVGPRPLRRFEHEMLSPPVAAQRSRMRPGITGLWQVRGRSDVAWDERINLDYAHVRNWTLSRDVQILLETVPAMVKGR